MKYYVIGDIHGEIDKLESVLDQINVGEGGTIIFLGDYVDRGKRSSKVLSRVQALVEKNHIALKGNHDDMMVKCSHNTGSVESMWWKKEYLKPTIKSYYSSSGWDSNMYKKHIRFISGMPHVHTTETFHFSHSGDPTDLLWGRPKNEDYSVGTYPLYNVHGHTPIGEPFIGEFRANLDTGACFKGRYLSCGVWEEGSKDLIGMVRSE